MLAGSTIVALERPSSLILHAPQSAARASPSALCVCGAGCSGGGSSPQQHQPEQQQQQQRLSRRQLLASQLLLASGALLPQAALAEDGGAVAAAPSLGKGQVRPPHGPPLACDAGF